MNIEQQVANYYTRGELEEKIWECCAKQAKTLSS